MSATCHADLSHGSADNDSTVGGWQFDAGASKSRPSTTRRRDFATRFCAAAGSAPITRRTQRPIPDDVKLCCQDGPTNSPSPVRGCHKESVAAAPPLLRVALRSVLLQWDLAPPSLLAPQPALAWARGAPRLWRHLGGAAPPPADEPSR